MDVRVTLKQHPEVEEAFRMEIVGIHGDTLFPGSHLDVMADVATPELLGGMYVKLLGELYEKLNNRGSVSEEEG